MMSMMARAIRTKPTLPVPPWASMQVANTEAEKANATNQYVNFVKGSPNGVRMVDAEKAMVELWCSTIVNDLVTKKDQFPRAEGDPALSMESLWTLVEAIAESTPASRSPAAPTT